MTSWSFLTNHARVLLCIARDPGMRLRDLAASLGITERSAHGIVTDLAEAGDVLAFWPAPTRGRNGGLPDPIDDLGRFLQLRGKGPLTDAVIATAQCHEA